MQSVANSISTLFPTKPTNLNSNVGSSCRWRCPASPSQHLKAAEKWDALFKTVSSNAKEVEWCDKLFPKTATRHPHDAERKHQAFRELPVLVAEIAELELEQAASLTPCKLRAGRDTAPVEDVETLQSFSSFFTRLPSSRAPGSTSQASNPLEEHPASSELQTPAEPFNLAKLTVLNLRALAKTRGLSGYSKLKKDDLIRLLSGET